MPDTPERPDAQNRTDQQPPAQAVSRDPVVVDIDAHRVTYDEAAIGLFLGKVFHAGRDEENVLVWATKTGTPGYPSTLAGLHKVLRGGVPRALYYGTSTAVADDDGNLRNKHSCFDRLHVIVLDDVGSKVELEKLPKALHEPSYVIESSPGNFQFGYVLDTPIEDLALARALVQLVYDSGFTDGAGGLPMKLVRLPAGVNGKNDDTKRLFRVRLVEEQTSWRHWSPAALLEACGCELTWDEVVEKGREALKRPRARSTSAWSPLAPVSPNLDGGVDPVLEWLYDEGLVSQETNEWVTIRCPQGHLHTTGTEEAGYSPLGRGEDGYEERRGFKCFHEHCRDFTTSEFLSWVAANGGPEAAIWDRSSELNREWVYDAVNDIAIQVFGSRRFKAGVSSSVLKNVITGTLLVQTGDRVKKISAASAWLNDGAKIVVNGTVLDPTSTSPLIERGAETYVNTFHRPDWSGGDTYDADVTHFKNFLRYLIPDETDREFFIDWLAAKYQNMGFRGPAVLMIAKTQGTGRGTLAKMIGTLLGDHNVTSVTFPELTSSKEFNDWQESPVVVTHETLDVPDATSAYKAYERLKTIIDPSPVPIRVRVPYRKAVSTITYSSHLLFSNHENAVIMTHDDRRFMVLENARVPARPRYFSLLYDWLAECDEHGPVWARSVARWLDEREVNMDRLLAPPERNAAKEKVTEATITPTDELVRRVIEAWPCDYVSVTLVREAIGPYAAAFGLDSAHSKRSPFERAFQAATDSMPGRGSAQNRVRVDGKQCRVRCKPGRVRIQHSNDVIAEMLATVDLEKVREAVAELAEEL